MTQMIPNHTSKRLVVGPSTVAREKFQRFRAEMNRALIERPDEIDLVLTALLAREHCLLVGPPGIAKSLLLDSLSRWIGGNRFSILLTKFTAPEELFGPVSLQGLKADQYRRITTGKLPEAHFVYLDEIWKASSAILNTLIRILNERVFENGDGVFRPVPLVQCVASSNEFPNAQEGGAELNALYDRFMFRKKVRPIASQKGLERLLFAADLEPVLTDTLSQQELKLAQDEAAALSFTPDAELALLEILRKIKAEGIRPGDRRMRKSVNACRAYAYLNGAAEVQSDHLEILSHLLWEDPQEQPEKVAEIVQAIANPIASQINSLLVEVEQILAGGDPKDVTKTVGATKKLGEVGKKLAFFKGAPKGDAALAYVSEQLKQLKMALVESM